MRPLRPRTLRSFVVPAHITTELSNAWVLCGEAHLVEERNVSWTRTWRPAHVSPTRTISSPRANPRSRRLNRMAAASCVSRGQSCVTWSRGQSTSYHNKATYTIVQLMSCTSSESTAQRQQWKRRKKCQAARVPCSRTLHAIAKQKILVVLNVVISRHNQFQGRSACFCTPNCWATEPQFSF